ncbi:hypothetical protein MGA3_09320 [Bacillus methanolicus MGA3]|nr:hypothetical protein MGA3_09320 [Bacillus methanolicus MGA3]
MSQPLYQFSSKPRSICINLSIKPFYENNIFRPVMRDEASMMKIIKKTISFLVFRLDKQNPPPENE